MSSGRRILVLGAGVSGLSSAVRLLEAGYSVEIRARERPADTTSAVAAAIWYPYLAEPADRVLAWSGVTLHEFVRLSADPATGIILREGVEVFREAVTDPAWAPVVPGFRHARSNELPAGFTDGYVMRLPVIDMSIYLGWLERQVLAAGATLIERSVQSFEDVRGVADLIVNCTGLGARDLCHDQALVGVRGQTVVVDGSEVSTFLIDESTLSYIIPRVHDTVLGGTADENACDARVDDRTAASIIDRCGRLMPALARAPVRGHKVGIRPCRTTVRLEWESLGGISLVHNYGHGGSGVTLSWGCADEVVALASATT
jgi:D-amino-acid oxidase